MLTTDEVLTRWVDHIYPDIESFKKALMKGKLKIYLGIDPTGPDLHLGHSTNLLLLKHLQKLGHQIIFLIGDATATIGDPSGKENSRKPLTSREVKRNSRTYKKQASNFLKFWGFNRAKLEFNLRWWGHIRFIDALRLTYFSTVNQLLERDMFQKRLKAGGTLSLAEFMYPLMQGYDSVVMGTDAEVGGTDQTFNMLMGRTLMRKVRNREKFVLATKLLENPKTGQKLMSKSTGSYIAINLPAGEMFGKVMSLPDEAVVPCFELCTEVSQKEVGRIRKLISKKPAEAKKKLAFEITRMYHGEKSARQAKEEFKQVFSGQGIPENAPVWTLSGKMVDLAELLVEKKVAKSKSEVRRLISQGGITLNYQKLADSTVKLENGVLRVGKRFFAKIK